MFSHIVLRSAKWIRYTLIDEIKYNIVVLVEYVVAYT